ncbi:MAG: prepilin-type N-terminal cleavage/methylation domain-containing protein [Planctomycetes bacterium]|nr:prepilin-type N-terminal cleavage/methylation domain-containing protein [Planctomycetota bacterium]
MKLTKCRNGFTLLELIVSSVLITLVLMAIYSALTDGLRLWRDVTRNVYAKEPAILATERLAKEIRNEISFSPITFTGRADSLSFPLLVRPVDEGKTLDIYMPAEVTYTFDKEKEILYRNVLVYGRDEEPVSRELLNPVKSVAFSYRYFDAEAKESSWLDEAKEDAKPSAIKVEITLKAIKNEPEEIITRIISLPR